MQACGVASFFLCVLCLFTLFTGSLFWGKLIFSTSLVLLMFSLILSFREILLSVQALELQLGDIEKHLPKKNYSFPKGRNLTTRFRKK